jgi:hypothetical protein
MSLKVTDEEENLGLDLVEHGTKIEYCYRFFSRSYFIYYSTHHVVGNDIAEWAFC